MWRDNEKVIRQRGGEFSTPTRTLTPPPAMAAAARSWRSAPCSPMEPLMMNNRSPEQRRQLQRPGASPETFHIVHKVPAGDSPYVKAKQVQLIDRDPNRAISLFWSAINSGDRVDSALKDMAIVMKQLDRTEEAIEAIKSFRHLCSYQAQGSLDNVLIDLYKRAGRMEEHTKLLHHKLKLLDEGVGFGGKRTKIARSQGKRFQVSIEQERSRLLGNLAWAYMQLNNYLAAEVYYREALSLEPDKNKQCNLAICLMQRGSIKEAKALLQAVKPSSRERELADSYIKSFDRASELLSEFESKSILKPNDNKEMKTEVGRSFSSTININSKPKLSHIDEVDGVLDRNGSDTLFPGDLPYTSAEIWKRESSYFQNQIEENGAKGTWVGSIFVEQENGQQPPSQCHRHFVDKWEKESSSWQSSVQRQIDFKNGNWVNKSGIEEGCSASKILKREGGDQFGCSASLNTRNSEISWEHDDESKKQPTMQSFLYHQNLLTESHTSVENTGAIQSQNPSGVLEQTSINHQLWHGRPQITGNENVKEKGTRNMGTSTINQDFSLFKNGKSWADMVEEEEEEFLHGCTNFDFDDDDDKWDNRGHQESSSASSLTPSKWVVHGWNNGDFFYDENINSNIISSTPPRPPTSSTRSSQSKLSSPAQHTQAQKSHMENLQQKLEFLDLKEEQCVKNSENYYYSVRNPSTRRALTFDQDEKKTSASASCNNLPSPLQKKALDFDDYGGVTTIGSGGSTCSKDTKVMRRGNRLKVFHDITTTLPDSPRSCGKDLKPPLSRGNRLKVFQDITLSPGSLKT